MTKRQKLELRRSQIRERLGTIAELSGDDLTEEIRTEQDNLETEYRDSERSLRALTIAEASDGDPADADPGNTDPGDGEAAELRSLGRRVELRNYMTAAAAGRDVQASSAEGEYRAALFGDRAREFGGVAVPWAAIAPAVEARADAVTGLGAGVQVQTDERPYIARVFAGSIADFLGVSFDTVGAGEVTHLVLTAGATAEVKDRDGIKEAEAATVQAFTMDPKRLTAAYLFRVEDLARSRGLEDALRNDLAMSIRSRLDHYILQGDGENGEPKGFLLDPNDGALAAPADPGSKADFAAFVAAQASAVDGLHANMLTQVRLAAGPGAYALAAQTFQGENPVATTSAAAYLASVTGGFRATAHFPAAASDIEQAIVARTGSSRNAVAGIWEGLELIRDPYSGASKGQVRLQAIALWDFKLTRPAAYKRAKFKLA